MKLNLSLKHVIVGILIIIGILAYRVTTLEKSVTTTADASGNQGLVEGVEAAELKLSENDHIKGSPDADIIIFEFSDFECPFCVRLHPTLKKLVEDYDGKVAWVYKHFPIGTHKYAMAKAIASECVAQLGGNDAFWKFTDGLIEEGISAPMESLPGLAVAAGVDESAFNTCLENEETKDIAEGDLRLGVEYGVTGTPGNVIYNQKTGDIQLAPGALPYESFKQIIDSML